MSEKSLSDKEWKAFSKGKDFKDTAWIKALAALEKADKAGPEELLKALDEVEKQAEALRKAHKADKELASYLDDADKALKKERKAAEQAAREAEQSESEEEESPALLTTKMVPLLRQVRKGETMQALVAVLGKETVVLLSRRPIAPTRRKLLAAQMEGGGAPKYVQGHCLFEENAYTFVVQTQAAGLAKKLKAALLAQTELRVKVRVRGEDPNDIDDDGEPAEDLEPGGAPDVAPQAGPAGTTAPQAPETASTAARENDASADTAAAENAEAARRFKDRLAALMPAVKDALAAAGPAAQDIKRQVGEAGVLAQHGDFTRANAALDVVDVLLKQPIPPVPPATPTAAAPAGAATAEAASAFKARLAGLLPRLQAAAAAGSPAAAGVRTQLSEAGQLAAKKAFDEANALLDEAERALERGPATEPKTAATTAPTDSPTAPQAGTAEETVDADEQRYFELFAQLEADYLAAVKHSANQSPELAEQIKRLQLAWSTASDAAEAGKYKNAVLVLDRLANGTLIRDVLQAKRDAADAKPTGIVAQRSFMLTRWKRIPDELQVELKELRAGLAKEQLDDDPAELADAINAHLHQLFDDLQNRMDDAITAGNMAVFKGLRQRVEQDSVIGHLLSAPFMDGKRFKQATLDAMTEIEEALTA